MSEVIRLTFKGEDGWSRPVFKGDNGRLYKSIELVGKDRETILATIHTCGDQFNGEPCSPAKGPFELADKLPWLQ